MLPITCFPGTESDRNTKILVAKHLLRRANILQPSLRLIDRIKYFQGHPDLEFVFRVLSMYYREFQQLPSREVLLMEMDGLNQQSTAPFDPGLLKSFSDVLEGWYAEDDWADEYVKSVITEAARLATKELLLEQVSDNDDIQEIQAFLQRAEREFSSDVFETLSIETAWTDVSGAMREMQKERLGQSFIDTALDGGSAPGEAVLLVAPSGGGKTTLGMQCAAAQVASSKHVVYLSTEQRLQGDMAIRQFVLGTGASRREFARGYAGLSSEVLERLDAVKDQWLEYFHFVDCRKSTRSITCIEDVFSPIDALIEQGKEPSLVILDWWGRLRSRLVMQQDRMSDNRFRHASADWMDTFLDGVRERRGRSLVLHQVSGAAAQKGPDALLTTHDAQEDKNLNNLFEFGFALSKLNSDQQCKINCDKARSAAATTGLLQLAGEYCKFVSTGPADVDLSDIANPSAAIPALDDLQTLSDDGLVF